ncbi:MAG TPA: hypothetical protein DEF34_03735 [Desulfotomaculum sp.]|nr:MAG: hypothetical protein VR67_16295 [Peptococcaceae bacterium BRH_c8a]KJS76656.1 MAG: hypothetical protein JL56_05160 [Desulfotomaculum sp. BICA1-6]HBX22739.1 hypothetical protein [Desulfotomaculum sp.]
MSTKIDYKDLAPLDRTISYRMSKEIKLCLWLGVVYLAYMFIVPVLNFTAPEFMKIRVWGGMSLTWFLTAIGAMFMAFAIAAIHVYFYTKDFFISAEMEEKTGKGADM